MTNKPLFCILGMSASGKTTICSELEKQYNLKQIPSYTTREKRTENEVGHTFITDKEFDEIKDNLVAYAETTGARYGVTKEQIDNEDYDLYVIDYSGLKYLKRHYKGDRKLISIYIDCPFGMRYERLMKRYKAQFDDDWAKAYDITMNRMIHDIGEFREAKEYCDFVVKNDNSINGSVSVIKDIIDESVLV